MNCARHCENLFNFVKVMPKILLVPFFSGHGVVEASFSRSPLGGSTAAFLFFYKRSQ